MELFTLGIDWARRRFIAETISDKPWGDVEEVVRAQNVISGQQHEVENKDVAYAGWVQDKLIRGCGAIRG